MSAGWYRGTKVYPITSPGQQAKRLCSQNCIASSGVDDRPYVTASTGEVGKKDIIPRVYNTSVRDPFYPVMLVGVNGDESGGFVD